jgi:hypothetical protein
MTTAGDGVRAEPRERAEAPERPTSLRLARAHLRLGSVALARAELEALSAHGLLDDDALLDLAEARWRTGDLPGAGVAAISLVDRGRDDAIALVIAAEAIAGAGRPTLARRLATRATDASSAEQLATLFAGMPRSSIWPAEADAAAEPDDATGVGVAGAGVPSSAPAAAIDAYAGGRAALAAGDKVQAAMRLSVAMRLEPGFAEAVLDAVGPRATEPALALVAGDALRLLGRETEARAAFDVARGAPSGGHSQAAATDEDDESASGDDATEGDDGGDEAS